jgi:large subunit ribosomal protein L4
VAAKRRSGESRSHGQSPRDLQTAPPSRRLRAPLLDAAGKRTKDVSLEAEVFGADVKPHVVHETVRAELNSRRAGNKTLKTRGLVAGGRGKPWRQKGTGRARAGTIRASQWTGGGAAFLPRTNFDVKVNRKVRRAAFRGALSAHAARSSFALVDASSFDQPSTKQAVALLDKWGQERPVLVVATAEEEGVAKSFRNVERVQVVEPAELEVAALAWARSLLVTQAALPLVESRVSATTAKEPA